MPEPEPEVVRKWVLNGDYGRIRSGQVDSNGEMSRNGNVICLNDCRYKPDNYYTAGSAEIYEYDETVDETVGENLGSMTIPFDGSQITVNVYNNMGKNWKLIARLFGKEPYAYFGRCVGLSKDGSIIALGGYADNFQNDERTSGFVRIYQDVNGSDWNSRYVQLGSDITGINYEENINNSSHYYDNYGENLGHRVSLSSDGYTVAIRSRIYVQPDNNGYGRVQVFSYDSSSSSWNKKGSDIPGYNSTEIYLPQEDNDIIAVGNIDISNNIYTYYVNVYKYNSNWDLIGTFTSEQTFTGYLQDHFGSRYTLYLSDNGQRIAIGEPNYDTVDISNVGRVHTYEYVSGTTWNSLGIISGENENDEFGASVTLSASGDILSIGIPGYDDVTVGADAGQVRTYKYEISTNSWENYMEPLVVSLSTSGSYNYYSIGEFTLLTANATRMFAYGILTARAQTMYAGVYDYIEEQAYDICCNTLSMFSYSDISIGFMNRTSYSTFFDFSNNNVQVYYNDVSISSVEISGNTDPFDERSYRMILVNGSQEELLTVKHRTDPAIYFDIDVKERYTLITSTNNILSHSDISFTLINRTDQPGNYTITESNATLFLDDIQQSSITNQPYTVTTNNYSISIINKTMISINNESMLICFLRK